jgi:L-alanine-DL-glutamate epimerase-like enolase superfamily enzyme
MKIVRIETHTIHEAAVVRIITDDGLEGIGQTGCFQSEITIDVLHKLVAPHFLGRDPWQHQALLLECLSKRYKFFGTFFYRALCGVDTALWDLLGKATDQPVYNLLGGAVRQEIPMYASSLTRETTPEEEAANLSEVVKKHGFKCVKIKVGGRMGQDQDAAPKRTERLIPLMREALGDDVDISADGNGAYSVSKALQVGRLLEKYNYFHFEEPCPFEFLDNTAQVAAALDIPVAGGEQDNNLQTFKRMIDTRTVDIIQLDIGYIGGISRARKVAELAELAGMACTPHCANRSMLQVFTLHFAAAMPACYHYQEWRASDDKSWAQEIYEPMLEVKRGNLTLPEKPGWGITLQNAFLKKAEHQVSRV